MYKQRRQQVLANMQPYSMAIICSGIAPYKIGDEKYPFCVDRNFYYLTGIDRENMTLLLVKHQMVHKKYYLSNALMNG